MQGLQRMSLLVAMWVLAASGTRFLNHGAKDTKTNRTKRACKAPGKYDPFDCYSEKGEKYVGLRADTESGRKCKNWIDQGKYDSSASGIGNHNYCRNPDSGAKDKPWCFTVDPAKEWEYCTIPECPEKGADPEAWEAPKGSKSEDAEAEGPCEYEPPKDKGYTTTEEGRACMDHKGDKWWLVDKKRTNQADEAGCLTHCQEMPGSQYFTFWGKEDDDGNNCGCYRECILGKTAPEDEQLKLTVNEPNSYHIK